MSAATPSLATSAEQALGEPSTGSPSRTCTLCGGPIPDWKRRDARWCSDQCREDARKARTAELTSEPTPQPPKRNRALPFGEGLELKRAQFAADYARGQVLRVLHQLAQIRRHLYGLAHGTAPMGDDAPLRREDVDALLPERAIEAVRARVSR